MEREYSLDAAAVCNTSYCEGLADAAVLLGDNCSLEDLYTALVAFLEPYVNLDGVTDVESGNVFLHARFADEFECIHFNFLLKFPNILTRSVR